MKTKIQKYTNHIIKNQNDIIDDWLKAGKEIDDLEKTFKWRLLEFTLWWNELLIKIINASK